MAKSAQIIGMHEVAKLFPMWDDGPPLLMWAEQGKVCWEDGRNNEFGAMNWWEAAERVLALSAMVFKSHEEGYYSDETRRMQKFIEEMEVVIRKAKEQTDDTPPGQKKISRTVVAPKEVDCFF